MPANLIVALVLLAVEGVKAYRAQQEKRTSDHNDPCDTDKRP